MTDLGDTQPASGAQSTNKEEHTLAGGVGGTPLWPPFAQMKWRRTNEQKVTGAPSGVNTKTSDGKTGVHPGRPRRSDKIRQLRLRASGSAGRPARPLSHILIPSARRPRAFKPGRDPTWNAEHVTQPPGLRPIYN